MTEHDSDESCSAHLVFTQVGTSSPSALARRASPDSPSAKSCSARQQRAVFLVFFLSVRSTSPQANRGRLDGVCRRGGGSPTWVGLNRVSTIRQNRARRF